MGLPPESALAGSKIIMQCESMICEKQHVECRVKKGLGHEQSIIGKSVKHSAEAIIPNLPQNRVKYQKHV